MNLSSGNFNGLDSMKRNRKLMRASNEGPRRIQANHIAHFGK